MQYLIFNIILIFYFSLFKTLSFSYKSHPIKTAFTIFNKFTILFTFEIEQLANRIKSGDLRGSSKTITPPIRIKGTLMQFLKSPYIF